jgi:hypothetical protein
VGPGGIVQLRGQGQLPETLRKARLVNELNDSLLGGGELLGDCREWDANRRDGEDNPQRYKAYDRSAP